MIKNQLVSLNATNVILKMIFSYKQLVHAYIFQIVKLQMLKMLIIRNAQLAMKDIGMMMEIVLGVILIIIGFGKMKILVLNQLVVNQLLQLTWLRLDAQFAKMVTILILVLVLCVLHLTLNAPMLLHQFNVMKVII